MIFIKLCAKCIIIVFICQLKSLMSEEHELDDHAKLVAQWNQVSSFNTGYEQPKESKTVKFDFGRLSKEQLRLAILFKFGQLKCGYLFGAQFHFQTVEDVFRAGDKSLQWDPLIVFRDESVTMVRSFFDVKAIEMKEIWLVYNHAFVMNEYFHIEKSLRSCEIRKTEIRKQNRFVLNELDVYLEQNCGHDNIFNVKYAKSESGKNDFYTYNILTNCRYSGTRKQWFVNKNLLVKHLYKDNLAKGLGNFINANIDGNYLRDQIDAKYIRFQNSFNKFYFPKLMSKTIWDALNKRFTTLLQYSKNHRLSGLIQLISFGCLNLTIIRTQQYLWLHVIGEFLKNINRTIDEFYGPNAPTRDTAGVAIELSTDISTFQKCLLMVIDKLNLNDNCYELLLQLNTIFETDLSRYKVNNGYRFEAKDNMVEQIQYEIISASQSLHIPPSGYDRNLYYNNETLRQTANILIIEIINIFGSLVEYQLLHSYLKFIGLYESSVMRFLNPKSAEILVLELVF